MVRGSGRRGRWRGGEGREVRCPCRPPHHGSIFRPTYSRYSRIPVTTKGSGPVGERDAVPRGFFLPVDTGAVLRAYTDIMMWVQRHPRYFDHAKAKFATGADGWLVACARVRDATVVTNEQSAPESRKEIKLPDVCDRFGVRRDNTFAMLRALKIRLDWAEDPVGLG